MIGLGIALIVIGGVGLLLLGHAGTGADEGGLFALGLKIILAVGIIVFLLGVVGLVLDDNDGEDLGAALLAPVAAWRALTGRLLGARLR